MSEKYEFPSGYVPDIKINDINQIQGIGVLIKTTPASNNGEYSFPYGEVPRNNSFPSKPIKRYDRIPIFGPSNELPPNFGHKKDLSISTIKAIPVIYEIKPEVKKHNHYFKDVTNLTTIDVYRVIELFGVSDPCLQHIVKKALCAGLRGNKDFDKDAMEIFDTSKRMIEMIEENKKDTIKK